jgi:hypothetical protein
MIFPLHIIAFYGRKMTTFDCSSCPRRIGTGEGDPSNILLLLVL